VQVDNLTTKQHDMAEVSRQNINMLIEAPIQSMDVEECKLYDKPIDENHICLKNLQS
jgi:hypothetical protein